MVARAAAPQLKSVFCSTRLANLRSRMLSTFLKITPPPGMAAIAICPAQVGPVSNNRKVRAMIRMIEWPGGHWNKKGPCCQGPVGSEAYAGGNHSGVALLIAHACSNVGAQVARRAIKRVVGAGVVHDRQVGVAAPWARLSGHGVQVGVVHAGLRGVARCGSSSTLGRGNRQLVFL